MTQIDKRFDEVVIESSSMYDENHNRAHKACCAECGTYHYATVDEYKRPFVVGSETLKFTAEMRAWSCCHGDDEPLDELPDWPGDLEMLKEM